jgi:hypothetical protein
MASTDSSPTATPAGIAAWAHWLHRYFLGALLATYALSGLLPGPGAWIREFAVTFPGGHQERA